MMKLDQDKKTDKEKERNTYESIYYLYEGRELTLNAFKIAIFPLKTS